MDSTDTSERSQEERANMEQHEVPPESRDKCREIIATLPKRNGWGFLGNLHEYQGFWCNPIFLEGAMLAHEHFKAQPSDIVLCSHPKTGSTWLKALAFAIATRSQYDISSTTPLLTKISHQCVPFLEYCSVRSKMDEQFPGYPVLHTHLPYSFLPKSIISSKCKLVYICREPKDTFVSLWYHSGKRSQQNEGTFISLEEAFELFCKGVNDYGPYWDHVLGYWTASLESPERILFLKYEEVLRDTTSCVKRLAEFMGCSFSEEEKKGDIVQQIVEFCSFNNLSNLEGKSLKSSEFGTMDRTLFYRKGQEGDWKNHFTREMKERMDNITKQNLRGSGLSFGI